jgi:hypothetical protein
MVKSISSKGPKREENKKQRLSNSRIGTFMSCRRKYYWTYIEDLAPIAKADYFQIGLVVHNLRERWIKNELEATDISGLMKTVQELYPDNDAQTTEMVSLEAARLFNGYVQNFEEDDFKLVSPEIILEKDIGEFILYARLDGVAIDSDGNHYRDELKTTSRMDSGYLQGLRRGLQTGISYWLMDEVLDFKTKGTLFEIIVKTKVPQFQRLPSLRDDWTVRYAKECVYGVWESIKHCGKDKRMFYPSMNCTFGKSVCPYETLCREDTPLKRSTFFTKYSDHK